MPSNTTELQVRCPGCGKTAAWQDNPHRPFCSERCQQIDLGHWADESYCIEGGPAGRSDDENDEEF